MAAVHMEKIRLPRGRSVFLGSALALFSCTAMAQLPVITLNSLTPPGAKSGGDVEVTVAGAELDEPGSLIFSHPGITAKFKADKTFTVSIAADVPAGIYDVRMTGKSGVSNPRAFAVGEWPEAVEKAANDKPETAAEIAAGSVFSGTIAAASNDYLKFTAKQGQRLFAQCETAALDSRLTPVMAILDGAGRELEVSRRGGFLDFTAPAEGAYFIRLRDLTYAGGPEFFYRLRLGSAPHLDFVLPLAVPAGTKSKVTLFGRGLPGSTPADARTPDGKPLEKLEVEVDAPPAGAASRADGLRTPASASVDGFSYRLHSPAGMSDAVFIGFTAGPVTVEQEPNDAPAQAQKLTLPCEVSGQFGTPGDLDCFGFDAKKGDVFWVEVISHRLGLPTSPFILVQRPGGGVQEIYGSDANAGGLRFNTAHNDPVAKVEISEDGAHVVQVRDLFGGTRGNPANTYRLILRKQSPDFRLAVLAEPVPKNNDDRSATPHALVLRGGETNAVRVVAFRRDGWDGEIEVRAEGLPAGVVCSPARIPPGKGEGHLLLTAAEKAERWSGAIRVLGRAKVGDAEVTREARGGAVAWKIGDANNEQITARMTRDFAMAVVNSETAPISIEVAEDKAWEAPAGGKIEVPLKIARRGGFGEALKLKAFGAPAIDALKELEIDAKAATATATIDLGALKVPAGAHTFYLRGQTKGKFRDKEITTTVFSTPIRIVVK